MKEEKSSSVSGNLILCDISHPSDRPIYVF